MFIIETLTIASTTLANVQSADGILDFVDNKANEATSVLRTIALLIAVGFVIVTAIASRGSLAKIVISTLAAGALVWVVFNVDTVSDSVDNEINSAPVSVSSVAHAPGPVA